MAGDAYMVDLVGQVVWCGSVACNFRREGRGQNREGKEHKLPTTEQVNSGHWAGAALGVSLSLELCRVALVTLHGGGAGTGQMHLPCWMENPGASRFLGKLRTQSDN